ncbi:hypothetical protein E2C01_056660 [Portunus trituberculatus]|uniref:Uncharacterized protein n=1 Tax=Portunus trituberculatus TaxID=210409 RepID=A0A5B7H172_PORTR|nr:hypothetical protein [Portunus trituberculatus]
MTTESAGCGVPGTSPSQGTHGVSLPRPRLLPSPHQPATCYASLATPLTLSSPFSKQQGQLPCLTGTNSRAPAVKSTSNHQQLVALREATVVLSPFLFSFFLLSLPFPTSLPSSQMIKVSTSSSLVASSLPRPETQAY